WFHISSAMDVINKDATPAVDWRGASVRVGKQPEGSLSTWWVGTSDVIAVEAVRRGDDSLVVRAAGPTRFDGSKEDDWLTGIERIGEQPLRPGRRQRMGGIPVSIGTIQDRFSDDRISSPVRIVVEFSDLWSTYNGGVNIGLVPLLPSRIDADGNDLDISGSGMTMHINNRGDSGVHTQLLAGVHTESIDATRMRAMIDLFPSLGIRRVTVVEARTGRVLGRSADEWNGDTRRWPTWLLGIGPRSAQATELRIHRIALYGVAEVYKPDDVGIAAVLGTRPALAMQSRAMRLRMENLRDAASDELLELAALYTASSESTTNERLRTAALDMA
ncbi:MAG: hypothetical protein AB7K09_20470, partial [Planctomycetota bacterium]